jgi:hypothetical protein
MSTPYERVSTRIAQLVSELMEDDMRTAADLIRAGIPHETLRRVLIGTHDMQLSTIVRVAEQFDCDVVLNFRKRTAPSVQKD